MDLILVIGIIGTTFGLWLQQIRIEKLEERVKAIEEE